MTILVQSRWNFGNPTLGGRIHWVPRFAVIPFFLAFSERIGSLKNSLFLMKSPFHRLEVQAFAILILLLAFCTRAQVTITSADMFNQPGQYYLAFANDGTNTTAVSGLLGTPGGPQAWDFSTGPQDVTNRFDYMPAANGIGGDDFVAMGATVAEKKVDLSDINNPSFLYFRQDAVLGRIDYGFYDPGFSPSQPQNVFTNGLQDFPATIRYGDSWQGSTVFDSVYSLPDFGDFPLQVKYTSTARVDAYGVVILPTLGFLNCLRVHEAVQYDFLLDFGDGGGLVSIGSQGLLNYYWLCPGHGIAVQVTSGQTSDGSPPPDDLPGGAAKLVRMFQTNHESSGNTNTTPSIRNLTCTLGGAGALIKWTLSPSLTHYTVQYATNLAVPPSWVTLQTVTNNYVIDFAGGSKSAPTRLYRVLGN